MLVLEYPRCSTCKRAIKFLKDNGAIFEDRDIVNDNPSYEELEDWINRSGKDIKKFFNISGMKYRELGLKDKLENMSLDDKIRLLSSDGMLVKRPLVITDKDVIIGFKENEWKELITRM